MLVNSVVIARTQTHTRARARAQSHTHSHTHTHATTHTLTHSTQSCVRKLVLCGITCIPSCKEKKACGKGMNVEKVM